MKISDADFQNMMTNCTLCPRNCHIDRTSTVGFCGQNQELTVARAALHFWEEPCLSGRNGSGTVFFGGCNLKCVFCQNHDIALGQRGKKISIRHLSDIFLSLQEQGANNINLVTPTPWIYHIISALEISKKNGLHIPVVYNTGGYESVETLKQLEGLVDIYLPDLKYFYSDLSKRYSFAEDYFEKACAALSEMFRQTSLPVFVEADGQLLMKKGIIVRHLLLPGQTKNAKKILRYLKDTYQDRIYISIMSQYTPLAHVSHIEELSRRVTKEEYTKIVDFCTGLNLTNVYIQEGECAEESFIPPFDETGV